LILTDLKGKIQRKIGGLEAKRGAEEIKPGGGGKGDREPAIPFKLKRGKSTKSPSLNL